MNCVILTAIRSGSTLLCNLLNQTGYFRYPQLVTTHPTMSRQLKSFEMLAPNPVLDPWLNKRGIKTKEACIEQLEIKTMTLRKQLVYKHEYRPAIIKIPMEHYQYYLLTQSDKNIIEEFIPNARFIWLERKDMLARTISAYFFFKSKVAHINSQNIHRKYLESQIPFYADEVLDVYFNHLKGCDWGPFLEGAKYLKIDYEDLISDPMNELIRSLEFLGIESKSIDRRKILSNQSWVKTERPETKEYIEQLQRCLIEL